MEIARRPVTVTAEAGATVSLNPSFNGNSPKAMRLPLHKEDVFCLNPSFNGNSPKAAMRRRFQARRVVLILLLMEIARRLESR